MAKRVDGQIVRVPLELDAEDRCLTRIEAKRGSCFLSIEVDDVPYAWVYRMTRGDDGSLILLSIPAGAVYADPLYDTRIYSDRLLAAFTYDGIRYHVFSPGR